MLYLNDCLFLQTASLDDETADRFKKELLSRVDMLETVQFTLIGLGSAAFVLCAVAHCLVSRNNNKLV